ncbi:MAG: S8 family serine peptidase, partial [Gammaproteobacteria bacterium]
MITNHVAGNVIYALIASLSLYGCGGGGGGNGSSGSSSGGTTFTLSGTITAQQGAAIDSDVNDVAGPTPTPNNTFDTAQAIPNTVTLGGYVNVAGAGPNGNSFASGDPSDVFSTELAANQSITLTIGDHPANDLDLFLYDSTGTPIANSIGVSDTEVVSVAAAGSYFVEVFAFSDPTIASASTYNLSVGVTTTAASWSLNSEADFVPGDVIVRFEDNLLPTSGSDTLAARAQSVGMLAKSGGPGRAMLLSLGDEAQKATALTALGVHGLHPYYKKLAGPDPVRREKWETLMAIKKLRARADVRYAEPNYIRQAFLTPNDEFYNLQWHYPQINLPQAWDITTGSTNTIAAVIDTGVLLNHPDLQPQLVPGFDFISNPQNANDGDGVDANPNDSGDMGGPGGASSFHGTHVAGTVAAASNNQAGVAGVAWNAR